MISNPQSLKAKLSGLENRRPKLRNPKRVFIVNSFRGHIFDFCHMFWHFPRNIYMLLSTRKNTLKFYETRQKGRNGEKSHLWEFRLRPGDEAARMYLFCHESRRGRYTFCRYTPLSRHKWPFIKEAPNISVNQAMLLSPLICDRRHSTQHRSPSQASRFYMSRGRGFTATPSGHPECY